MNCPICEGTTKVIDSRGDSESVRRRRECADCGYRFFTLELDEDMLKNSPQKVGAAPEPLRFSVTFDPLKGRLRLEKEEAGG